MKDKDCKPINYGKKLVFTFPEIPKVEYFKLYDKWLSDEKLKRGG